MAKLKEDELQRIKRIQDVDDDDLDLDITKRRRLAKRSHGKAGADDGADGPGGDGGAKPDDGKDTKTLLIFIAVIFGAFLLLIILLVLNGREPRVMTIDELHEANLQGKLEPEEGQVYNGYSFVNLGGVWYSRVQKGGTVYDITFNNGPKSVEDIPVEGQLSERFDRGKNVYITFDTTARGAKYITVANAGLSMALVKGFGYNLTASCTNNESRVCQKNGVVTCDDKEKAVIYFKEDVETKVMLEDNCVTVQGLGPDMVRAKDRLLMRWYGMIE